MRLQIREEAFGEDHVLMAPSLHMQAQLQLANEEEADALSEYLAVQEKRCVG